MRFPEGSDVYIVHLERGWIGAMDSHSLAVHPTQLYHALAGLFAVLLLERYRPNWHGGRLAIGMAFYGCARFLIEFYRDEYEQGGSILDLAQWLSIGFLITTILLWRNAKTRGEQYVKTPMRYDHVGTQ
jgi:prolipoprotein diacylglyceryltransferase